MPPELPIPASDVLPSDALATEEALLSATRSDTRHAARGGGIQVLTIIAQGVLTLTQILFARLFGEVDWGTYVTSLAALEILTRGGAAGADKAMLRYVAAFRASGNEPMVLSSLGTGLRLAAGVAGTLVVVVAVGASQLPRLIPHLKDDPNLAFTLPVMAPAAILACGTAILIQASLAAKVMRPNFLVRGVAEPLIFLVLGLSAWSLGTHIHGLATAYLLTSGIVFFLAVMAVRPIFGRNLLPRAWQAPRLPGFGTFALPIGGSELLNSVLQRADILLLSLLVGPGAVAVYGAAENLTRLIANVRSAFDSIAASTFSEAAHQGDTARLQHSLRTTTRWVVTAGTPLAALLVVLRTDLLGFWGQSYQAGGAALAVLAVGHFVNSSLGLTPWVLLARGRSRPMVLANMLAASLNIGLALFLIPRFGIVGTAIATVSSVVGLQVGLLLLVVVSERVHPFSLALLKPLMAGTATLILEHWIAGHIAHTWLRVAVVVVTGVVFYLAALVALRLPAEERALLRKFW